MEKCYSGICSHNILADYYWQSIGELPYVSCMRDVFLKRFFNWWFKKNCFFCFHNIFAKIYFASHFNRNFLMQHTFLKWIWFLKIVFNLIMLDKILNYFCFMPSFRKTFNPVSQKRCMIYNCRYQTWIQDRLTMQNHIFRFCEKQKV